MIYIRDLIRKKRNKEELTDEEIDFFVEKYFNDGINNEQISALVTLMYVNGLSYREMSHMTLKISETGKIQDIYKFSNSILDIHPIGGIEDKIIIILLSICTALGYPAIKIVDREIGFLDRIMDKGGYKLETDFEKIKEDITKNIIIIEEPENIAPLERKLYKLRNDIAGNDSPSLIAISLMSQKIAMGVKNVIFDITYGERAYVKNLKEARELAKYLVQMGKDLSKGVKCIITEMNEPIGVKFGNILELEEAEKALSGEMDEDVKELVYTLGNCMLLLMEPSSKKEDNINKIEEVIKNGKALEVFNNYLDKIGLVHEKALHVVPVLSPFEGYVSEINVSMIRVLAKNINAIRYYRDEYGSLGTGLEFTKKIGDKIEKNEIIGYIHIDNESQIENSINAFLDAFEISNKKIKKTSRIKEIF